MVTALVRHPEFRAAIRDMGSVALGLAAWGVMTGVAMVKSGMSLPEVLLMATLVFAGSSQLAAIPLVAAGAPMWVILATAFCVNLRFMVFSIHLRPYVMHQRFWRRIASGYLIADINYVFFTGRFPTPATDARGTAAQDAYWLGSGTSGWCIWAGSSLVGVALGNSIPVSWGLSFAGILALLGVLGALVSTRLRAVAAVIAGAAAVASFALPLKLNILVGIAAAVAVCMLLDRSALAEPASVKTS